MAIQVSGTTVIDDSRNLTNITSVDATTVASISAAGVGGGGTHDFVASGAISNGDVVVLNSDGTVSVVAGVSTSVGSSTVFESASTSQTSAAFDSLNNRVVITYKDGANSNYGTAVVGTVSGASISFGTPVVFESSSTDYTSAVFDSNSNKVVIAYRDGGNSNYGTAIVGTVSGTSISFGTPVVFESSASIHISATFDSNSNKVVVGYTDLGNSYYGTAVVGTVSGTSISFGTPVVFDPSQSQFIRTTFDSSNNKVVISYRDTTGTAIVGTVSGTSISFGSIVEYSSVRPDAESITFDSNSNKVVIAYTDSSTFKGLAVIGSVSGTSISFGTPVEFEAGQTDQITAVFDSNAKKVVVAYRDSGDSSYGKFVVGVVSGTSISFDNSVTFNTANSYIITSAFDSTSNKVVIAYTNGGNSAYGTSNIVTVSYTNAPSYIGVAAEAISDTVTGQITITSGINEGQTGLTIGQSYFVSDDGTLTTTNNGRKIGEAFSATNLQVKMKLTGDEMNAYLGGLV
jgi:hypothetical protein